MEPWVPLGSRNREPEFLRPWYAGRRNSCMMRGGGDGGRERERETAGKGERERATETETAAETERQRQRQTDRQTNRGKISK